MISYVLAPFDKLHGEYFDVQIEQDYVVLDNGRPYDESQYVLLDKKQARELRNILNLLNLDEE